MASKEQKKPTSVFRSLCNSATAAAIAEATTLPLDTAKVRTCILHYCHADCWLPQKSLSLVISAVCLLQVRLQLQNFSHDPVPRYKGPLQTVGRIMKDEGATAPFKVLTKQ